VNNQVLIENPVEGFIDSLFIEIIVDGTQPTVTMRSNHDHSIYDCSFTPNTLNRHIISIDYAGIVAEHNPFYCHVIQEKDIQLAGPAIQNQCLVLHEPTHFYFKLKDFLPSTNTDQTITYESGYSSNDDVSIGDSSHHRIDNDSNYRVTITDAQGHIKSNVAIQNNTGIANYNVRVDFTPDEKILFINISCAW
jgi:hypothetical protein